MIFMHLSEKYDSIHLSEKYDSMHLSDKYDLYDFYTLIG